MKKASIKRWLYVTIMFGFFSNFAPPIIPKFLKNLSLGNSMFGWVFAGMALTNFLFSPLWSKLAGKYGSAKVMSIIIFFYALSQFMFGISTTAAQIIFARLFGGFFVGGLFVSQLLFILENTNKTNLGDTMVKNATNLIVFGTFGFLTGGILGDFSIRTVFNVQVAGLLLTSLYVLVFLKDNHKRNVIKEFNFREVNPFASFKSEEFLNNKLLRNILIVSILASVASVIYDQAFNYYLTDFYDFPTSVNGIVKAMTGIMTFAINSTLTIYIIKRTNLLKSLSSIFIGVATFIMILLMTKAPLLFLATNIIYYSIHAAYIPIVQKLITDSSKDQNKAVGTLNSFRSLGMIIGSSLVGLSYTVTKSLPFILSSVIFLISAIICLRLLKLKGIDF